MADFKYRAFISYSWADAKWGNWLHRRLETYRTPAALVGKQGAYGPVPARLHPIFKDREEEAAGSSIGKAVERALANSEFLIVVCSPHSARSKWVSHEIAWFRTHRNPDKILALIVDGEPGGGEDECFPAALTHHVDEGLAITDQALDAPLAADARITGDGKRHAILKLAAPMLGVGLDELVNRDERRRTVRTRIVVGASLALALVMSGLTLAAIQARKEAERQRSESDGLVEFMLTDLRDKLEPVGRLDALDAVGQRALDYYARQKLSSLSADELGRRSRALHLVGEIRNIRGDSEQGLIAFRQAAKTTSELLAREPDDEQRIFDHAQSVFWVGYIAYERGEIEEAEAEYREYKRLADRLVELNPDKLEWRLESSYAETNLGVMYDALDRPADAERAFTLALRQVDAVAAGEDYGADRQVEIGTIVNWLGKAERNLGKYAEARKSHAREVAIYRDILRREPENVMAKIRLALALQFLGKLDVIAGDLDGGMDHYRQGLASLKQLRALEPDNTEWQHTEVSGQYDQVGNLLLAGRHGEARSLLQKADAGLASMLAKDSSNAEWAYDFRMDSVLSHLQLALGEGRTDTSSKLIQAKGAWVRKNEARLDPRDFARFLRISGDVARAEGRDEDAARLWRQALAKLADDTLAEDDRFYLLKRLGRAGDAAVLAERLDRRGYRDPAYLAER